MNIIGEIKFDKVVLDCKDPIILSEFYSKLLSWKKDYITDNFVIIVSDKYSVNIGFQKNEMYVPPVWPEETNEQQQMLHLDFAVKKETLQEWVEFAVSLGAKKADNQYGEWVVMFDPEGHPFCFDVL